MTHRILICGAGSASLAVIAALAATGADAIEARPSAKRASRTGGSWIEPILKEPRKRAQWKDESNKKGRNR